MSKIVNRVGYEWAHEVLDENGDIVDIWHFDKYPGESLDENTDTVLIRDVAEGWSDDFDMTADLKHRAWAYVENGRLPEVFDDGVKVPQRFHKETAS